jgi:hypothetical protein
MNTEYYKSLSLRLPASVYEYAVAKAKAADTSLNAVIVQLIQADQENTPVEVSVERITATKPATITVDISTDRNSYRQRGSEWFDAQVERVCEAFVGPGVRHEDGESFHEGKHYVERICFSLEAGASLPCKVSVSGSIGVEVGELEYEEGKA